MSDTCSVEGCADAPLHLGMCTKHYFRQRRHGSTELKWTARWKARRREALVTYLQSAKPDPVDAFLAGYEAGWADSPLRRKDRIPQWVSERQGGADGGSVVIPTGPTPKGGAQRARKAR